MVEHWEPNENGGHHPLFFGFIMPEEMEPEDFNEKVMKRLNEHNEIIGIEFATRQSRRLFKNPVICLKSARQFVSPIL